MGRLLAFALVASVLVMACGAQEPSRTSTATSPAVATAAPPTAAAPIPVRIGWIKVAGQAGVAVAQAMGFDKEFGISIQLTAYPTAPESVQSIVTGNSDAAFGATIPTGPALVLAGAPIRSVLIYASGGDRTALVAIDPNIKSPADLRGKTIASPVGSSTTTFVELALKAHGVPRTEVKFVNMQYSEMAAALATRQVNAVAIVEPTLSSLLSKDSAAHVLEYAGKYVAVAGSFYMKTDFAKSDAGYRTYLAIAKGMQYMRQKGAASDEIAGIIAAATGAARADVQLGTKKIVFDPRVTPWIWQKNQEEMDYYVRAGNLKQAIQRDELYYMDLGNRAVKEHPELFADLGAYLKEQGAPAEQIAGTTW